MVKVLLDTSFLLPIVGIRIKDIKDKDLRILEKLSNEKKVTFYASDIIWVEFVGIIHRLLRRVSKNNRDDIINTISMGLSSLEQSGYINWINISRREIEYALLLKEKGHKDVIDNLLYSIALLRGMYFLSIDTKFINFLKANNFKTNMFITPEELLRLSENI
ncbi:MAG: PIN domain-containing protein [Candidatus Odinarchaeota archaeon]|nr:PIN domain-containing protein [Candidatus Odinarchaeota archaeon]